VTSRMVQSAAIYLASMLGTTYGATPSASSKLSKSEMTYVKATFKVFVTEAGVPTSAEFVRTEPATPPDFQEWLKQTESKSILSWTFKPNQKHGKPVAGYLLVVIDIDLAP